ncbi:MAG: hypothetical protein CBR30_04760 [Dictyoglomus sp. NZ13-RE01]|nr:MAG: hypothetical protein CBR30_04760 [Dictyoglomus sp. NZ13-RE01]
MRLIKLFALVTIFLFSVSFASNIVPNLSPELLFDSRALGLGGAVTALSDPSFSFLWNPAGLEKSSLLGLGGNLSISLSPLDPQNLENWRKVLDLFQSLSQGEAPSSPQQYDGTLKLGISGGLRFRNFSLAMTNYFDGNFNANIESTQTATLHAEGNNQTTLNVTFASSLANLPLGLAKLRYGINIAGIRGQKEVYDYNNGTTYTSSQVGYGVKVDAGVLLNITPILRLGLVGKNLYSTWLSTSSQNTDFNLDLPEREYRLGVMAQVPILGIKALADIWYPEMGEKTVHIGVEIPFVLLSLRAGAITDLNLNPFYYTLGAGINLLLMQIDAGVAYDVLANNITTAVLSGKIGF